MLKPAEQAAIDAVKMVQARYDEAYNRYNRRGGIHDQTKKNVKEAEKSYIEEQQRQIPGTPEHEEALEKYNSESKKTDSSCSKVGIIGGAIAGYFAGLKFSNRYDTK